MEALRGLDSGMSRKLYLFEKWARYKDVHIWSKEGLNLQAAFLGGWAARKAIDLIKLVVPRPSRRSTVDFREDQEAFEKWSRGRNLGLTSVKGAFLAGRRS
jgi:hypothetical protein